MTEGTDDAAHNGVKQQSASTDDQPTDSPAEYAVHRRELEQTPSAFHDLVPTDIEPADPIRIDDDVRRRARLVPPRTDVSELADALVTCGCGSCPEYVEPDADEITGAFEDAMDRADHSAHQCDETLPITVGRASGPEDSVYAMWQRAEYQKTGRTSRLERVERTHRNYMDAERELLDEWYGEVTTALLSLRPSPVEKVRVDEIDATDAIYYGIGDDKLPSVLKSNGDGDGQTVDETDTEYVRCWLPPTEIDHRLSQGWSEARRSLSRHLDDFEYAYAWVVGVTDSAATPHLHVHVWIRDPDDEITVDHLRPAVESFVSNCAGAEPEAHPVEAGQSDAARIQHTPLPYDQASDDVLGDVLDDRGGEPFPDNSRGFAYCMNQRPEWALKRIIEGNSDDSEERVNIEGAAASWASSNDWIGCGNTFGEFKPD